MQKLLALLVLLGCTSAALGNLIPTYQKPVCVKKCKDKYEVCKDVELEVEECPQPVYKPVYVTKKAYFGHGRKLQNGCPKVKKIVKKCEYLACTVTTYVDKEVCKDVCTYHGRKLANYLKPAYVKPTYVKPVCTKKCETIKVPTTTCLAQCVYEECPKPVVPIKPVYKPVYKDVIGKVFNITHRG